METMHASVDATKTNLLADACSIGVGMNASDRAFLTPLALLESARAFDGAATALNHSAADQPKDATVYLERVERASMAVLYNVLWRWTEVRQYARNQSIPWPLPTTQQAAFARFASIYNASGNQYLSKLQGPIGAAVGLHWFHSCIFATAAKPDCKC